MHKHTSRQSGLWINLDLANVGQKRPFPCGAESATARKFNILDPPVYNHVINEFAELRIDAVALPRPTDTLTPDILIVS